MNERERIIKEFHVFTENPTPRVPICLCVDLSGSMQGEKINNLNLGIQRFLKELEEDDVAQFAADICIIGFGGGEEQVDLICDFSPISEINLPVLQARGRTPMGRGVSKALSCLKARKELYKNVGNHYYQPWLVIMSDGLATDDISEAAKEATKMVNDRLLTVLPIAIGNCNTANLKEFSPKTPPLFMDELKFAEFFEWLSKSVSRVSSSKSGEAFEFNFERLKWSMVK